MVSGALEPATKYVLGVLGGITVFLLVEILRILHQDNPLERFSEDPDQTTRDFERLTIAAVIMFTAFALFTVGAYYQNTYLLLASRIVEVTFFIAMISIFYDWWRRFQ